MRLIGLFAFLVLAACSQQGASVPARPPSDATFEGNAQSDADQGLPSVRSLMTDSDKKRSALPDYFDCVREAGGLLIAAHRGGGTAAGLAENSLPALERARSLGFNVFEIDISESKDGVLFLHHDDRLNRTTTGNGYVSDTDWEAIASLRHINEDGKVVKSSPLKLSDALLWAKGNGAILELDRKDTTSFKNIAAAVKAAGAQDNVIYITYSDEEAGAVAKLAPDAMLTATAYGDRNISKLKALGVDPRNLIAWTGTREAFPDAFARLRKEGVEPAFGTLGRPGERLDDVYWADGDGHEYEVLAEQGLVLLATDEPYRVADAIMADDKANTMCGR